MRVMAPLLLLLFLSGCANELCVQRGVFTGDEMDYNGRKVEVVSISGESYFCRVKTHPIMAKVKFKQECPPPGPLPGNAAIMAMGEPITNEELAKLNLPKPRCTNSR